MEFRFLQHDYHTAYENMAIDEAIMKNVKETGIPTIRFYKWKPATISIGYFQSLLDEVDLEKCSDYKVDYVRRITGGGAVYHDTELTYSFVCTEESNLVSKNIIESYKKICQPIILGLGELGLKVDFVPLNDLVVNGKKISGNAQTRRQKVVLQHGTLLIDVDVDKMFSLLKVPNEKIRDKLIANVKQRVTGINNLLENKVSFEDLVAPLKRGFEQEFSAKLVKGKLTDKELEMLPELEKRFKSNNWNHKR